MRDNLNISALSNNMFADLKSLIPVPDLPVVTNISTNVYYGYQALPVKNDYEESNLVENTAMETQYCLPEYRAHIQEITRVLNRKRRCPEQQETEFKKKRRNENFPDTSSQPKCERKPTHTLPDIPLAATCQDIDDNTSNFNDKMVMNFQGKLSNNQELKLEEELLKQTHGFCSYHWRNETDL